MARKKHYLILDTETIGDLMKGGQVPYNIGYLVADSKGEIIVKRNYLVEEIFLLNIEDINNAYYACKLPLYINKAEFKSAISIIEELLNTMQQFNINTINAYNVNFDKKALKNLLAIYTDRVDLLEIVTERIAYHDIMSEVVQKLCREKYIRFCIKNGFISEKGNISYKADTVGKYYKGMEFEEEHTALNDCILEEELLRRARKSKYKAEKENIIGWKFLNERRKELSL